MDSFDVKALAFTYTISKNIVWDKSKKYFFINYFVPFIIVNNRVIKLPNCTGLYPVLCNLVQIFYKSPSYLLHFFSYPKLMTLFWKEMTGITMTWVVLNETGLLSMAPPWSIIIHPIYIWAQFPAQPPNLEECSFYLLKKWRHLPNSLLLAPLSWIMSSSKDSANRLSIPFADFPWAKVQFVQEWDLNSFGAVSCSSPIHPITLRLCFLFAIFLFFAVQKLFSLAGKTMAASQERSCVSLWHPSASHQGCQTDDLGLLWCSSDSKPHQILLNDTLSL